MKTRNLILSGAVILGVIMFSSCDNNDGDKIDTDVDTEAVEQSAAIDDIVESVFDELDAELATDQELAGTATLKSSVESSTCLTVTFETPDDARYPKVITFDYGTENCEDRFGRVKSGKVIVTKTGPFWEAGSERIVTFEDFYVNDNAVTGSRNYKNEGVNEDGFWEFSIAIDVTIETTEGISWTRTANRIRTMVAGADTPRYAWDDEFLITGSSSGTCSEGYSVEREIVSPLHRKRTCRFPVEGIVEIVKTKGEEATKTWLNYGDGECDFEATVTDEEGNEETIYLGKRFAKRNN